MRAWDSTQDMTLEPNQPHYQSTHYNHLNGGVARYYESIKSDVLGSSTMSALLKLGHELFGRLQPHVDWHVEVHQFRIDAQGD